MSLFLILSLFFFFFNDTATTDIYTLSLHDALPILAVVTVNARDEWSSRQPEPVGDRRNMSLVDREDHSRSEEHTSELQSLTNLVCRLLLEKKKKQNKNKSNCL